MNLRLLAAMSISWLAIGAAIQASAEDIDIYTIPRTKNAAPNTLIFIDNTSNWSNAAQGWNKTDVSAKCGGDKTCLGYVSAVFGSDSTLVQGQVELRAIKVVLNELACSTSAPFEINAGLMLFTSGTVDSNSAISGYIRQPVHLLAPGNTGCNAIVSDLDAIDAKITTPDFKGPSAAPYGTALFEAFKYFGGYANTNGVAATSPGTPTQARGFGPIRYSLPNPLEAAAAFVDSSKTQYASPLSADSCGGNFLIMIGNAFPNQENLNPKTGIPIDMEYLGLAPSQLYVASPASKVRFADEWTQFLARTDVSKNAGFQPLKTFTVNVFNGKEDTDQTALLTSMAKNGGTGVGGAFKVNGDLMALIEGLKTIFLQINAVNSAFASASLPISVNTQGTYLNQVFIGMFRPANNAFPRWAGNLKQYQFKLTETVSGGIVTRSLVMADANNKAAIDNTTTGFIRGCARSFWTSDSGTYWQNIMADPAVPSSAIAPGSCTGTEFNDSPDGKVVERGGAAEKLRKNSRSTSAIQTCAAAPSSCNTSSSMPTTTEYQKWILGSNVGDGFNTTATITDKVTYTPDPATIPAPNPRPTIHGGVIHSRPLALNYGASGTDDIVVFYAADDGLLRAIDGSNDESRAASGSELWAFVAPEFLPGASTAKSPLERSRDNFPFVSYLDKGATVDASPKDYFFDGSIGAYSGPKNADGTGTKVTYIYPAMRRGGRTVYAFDATTHPRTAAPKPLWRYGCNASGICDPSSGDADVTKLGQTWSTPRIVRVKDQSSLYAVFGAGYDVCEDTEPRDCSKDSTGHGIFVLDAVSGKKLRYIDLGSGAGHIVADIVQIDTNNDGFADVLYAADTLGNLWRINLYDPSVTKSQDQSNWLVTKVATVGDWGSTNVRNRKFLYQPDVVNVGKYNIVLIGSGNREKPLDSSAAAKVKNRFYGFWDEFAVTGTSFTTIDDHTDCDAAGDLVMSSASCQVMNTTTTTIDYLPIFQSDVTRPRGWVIDLDATTTTGPNEQVVTTPATVGGYVNFSTFQAINPDACSSLGTARGYAACFLDGGATCDAVTSTTGTTRSETFAGGGLPPSPVTGTVLIDGKIVPFIIGGKPDAGGGSPLEVKIPAIPIKQNRTKVYRYKRVD